MSRSVARSAHAEWSPPRDRVDPVALLRDQERDRMPELLPIRHQRMLASPFAFFRGAAAIMAADLAHTPSTGLRVQICGDAHLANFGIFAAPDRGLVFDVNDFDETAPGPWEWDLKRLVASVAVLGRELGIGRADRRRAVREGTRAYRSAMREFAGMGSLDVWYARLAVDDLPERATSPDVSRQLAKIIRRARRRNSLRALRRLTHEVDGRRRIAADPPLVVPIDDLVADGDAARARVLASFDDYCASLAPERRQLLRGYEPVDAALKVVGVGSVGTRCWIVLLLGVDDGDPLFLQVKEAGRSVVADAPGPSGGERVVVGQRVMQTEGDILLGWFDADLDGDGSRRSFYVRQLWDDKGTIPVEAMDAGTLLDYARACGWSLAHGHARSGPRGAIAEYVGSGTNLDRALATFAEAYADQNAADFAAYEAAARAGEMSLPAS